MLFYFDRFFLKQRLKKNHEKYKQQLQSEFLKIQHQTTQLYSIDPELYSKIKYAEGEFFKLFGPIKRRRPINVNDINKAWSICLEARNFFNVKLLFISEQTQQLTSHIFNLLTNFSNNSSLEDKTKKLLFDKLEQQREILETQMKKELSGEMYEKK